MRKAQETERFAFALINAKCPNSLALLETTNIHQEE